MSEAEEKKALQTGVLWIKIRVEKGMEAAVRSYLARCDRNGFTPTEEDVIAVMMPFIHFDDTTAKEPPP